MIKFSPMIRTFIFCWLFIGALVPLAQGQNIGFEEIDESKVTPWSTSKPSVYDGLYRFGDSEGESTLVLFHTEQGYFAQIRTADWEGEDLGWVYTYRNLEGVQVADGVFSSENYYGRFVRYSNAEGAQPGLRIDNPWSGIPDAGNYEIGLRISDQLSEYYPGAFIQASIKVLNTSDLASLTAEELRLMRNEIFARYGYTFRAGGAMAAHFGQQSWYQATHTQVDDYLTGLEKANIQTILAEEKRRN